MTKEEKKTQDVENNISSENEISKSAENNSETKSESQKEEGNLEKSPEEKILELEDKLARTFAEMENQRRRFEKEKDDAYEYGGFNFAKEALSLIDNLERSKDILKSDEKLKDTEALKKTLEHFDIIYNDIISIFNKNNIQQIESINKKLDPNLHQAMMEIEDNNKDNGTIIKEIQKGFTIKDRLLRPSLVGVSKKPIKTEEKIDKNKEIPGNN